MLSSSESDYFFGRDSGGLPAKTAKKILPDSQAWAQILVKRNGGRDHRAAIEKAHRNYLIRLEEVAR